MVQLRLLKVLFLSICCCGIQASRDQNVWIFKVLAQNVPEEVTYKAELDTYKVKVNLSSSLHETDSKFLGLALGSPFVKSNFESSRLISLATELSPSNLRLGGTYANFLIFDPVTKICQKDDEIKFPEDKFDSGFFDPTIANFTMTGKQWESFHLFLTKSGFDLLFDVNNFLWKNDGSWDSTNAELLLNYSAARGIRIPFFQLGNEPNAYWGNFQLRLPPPKLVADYKILKNLTSKYPLYASSPLIGPDVSVNMRGGARLYYRDFVAAGAYNVVDEYSIHHYYLGASTATVSDFLSPTVMDSLKDILQETTNLSNDSPRPLPFSMTETSSCYAGGASGLSNRYVGGFLWLDKLGLAAQYGVKTVYRQSFFGSSYGLLTTSFDPLPDYYLSVLYKRLIEGPVFNVTIHPANPNLRVYAHCARKGYYSPGAVVVYYLNLNNTAATLSLDQFPDADLDLYQLTPGDSDGLSSKLVKLNGNNLQMSGDTVPAMPPKAYKGEVTVDAQSFGFIVIPRANVTACINYYRADNCDKK